VPSSCNDYTKMGEGESGDYIIDPMTKEGGGKKFYAFCNFTDGKIRGFIIIKKLIKITR
jgi:hypothetical protein